ncbi:MAG: hypothetical protein RBQ97_08880 [Acholeplasma sp.]|nr:hypothetical protein [Acholeplasma sp.]
MITYRWQNSVYLQDEEIVEFYKSKEERSILYILGKGFDPRMCEGLKLVSELSSNMKVCLLTYEEGIKSSSHKYDSLIDDNYSELFDIISNIEELKIDVNLSRLPIFLKKNMTKEFFSGYDRIIIDISSLPQSISFNLIKYIMNMCKTDLKIDIIACENSAFDEGIIPTGLSEKANYLNGFNMFSMEMESDDAITIWLPLLGKNRNEELEKIYQFISPNEICPVLPFPSKNPRKSDEILCEVGELLFSTFNVDKNNILYIAENNIIHTYQRLCSTVEYYNKAIKIIKKTKFIFSIGSSKLIGIGALLANLEISNNNITTSFSLVENDGYLFDIKSYKQENNNVFCLCLNDSVFDW